MAGMHLQFKVLPFGLSTASRVFTKLLVNAVAHLRQWGIHVHPYLDDLLIQSDSYHKTLRDTHSVMDCLREHGFQLNLAKSELQPSQRIQHLGMILDT